MTHEPSTGFDPRCQATDTLNTTREPSAFKRIFMYGKSTARLVTTLAIAATFAAINTSVNLAMAANAEGSQQGRVGIDFVESYTPTPTDSQYVSPFKPYDEATAARPQAITLAAMPTHELAKKTIASSKIGGPTIVSVPREVVDTDTVAKTASRMQWITSAHGNRIGSIRIKSTDAKGVFIGVVVDQLPSEAMLRFHADKSSTAFHVSAEKILTQIQTNISAGDNTDFGRTYWAPIFDSDDVTMEIELPAGISTDTVRISIPLISHVFVTSAELDKKALNQPLTGAGTCNVDATCYPEYDNESRSVARIYFLTSPASAAFCTGNLLNNKFSDGIPYFLTARHCISTQTLASNILAIKWLHRTSACNTGVESTPQYQTGGGAVLLHDSIDTDTSFLRLIEPPPAVARFAAWTAVPVNLGEVALGIHNPRGDLQEASFATVDKYVSCTTKFEAGEDVGADCGSGDAVTGNHLWIVMKAGSVAGGSSGSGIFVTRNNARYLVGQLHGSAGSCTGTFSETPSIYGRFDLPYRAALNQWLSPDIPGGGKAFDIDGNGKVDAATDGVLMTRYMLGLRGNALIAGVLGFGATRNSVKLVTDYLQTLSTQMDVDGDGATRASTDALLITRYMRNVRNSALVKGAVSGGARTLDQIQNSLFNSTGMAK
jgi:lysyl endopeptidase